VRTKPGPPAPRKKVGSGDKVLIRIIDAKDVDKPRRVQVPLTPAARRKEEERYVREVARKLGWKIVTPSNPGAGK
jgi:hypothetical protein